MQHEWTIGVLSPELGGFYFGGLLQGLNQCARAHGSRVLAIQAIETWFPARFYRSGSGFRHPFGWDEIDGWVVILNAASPEDLRQIQAGGKPIISLSSMIPEVSCATVLPDNRSGTAAATRHLIEHGHTRIAFAGFLEQDDIRQRYEGYLQALAEAGIEPDPALFFPTMNNIEEQGQQVGRQLVERGMPCSAIVAGTDSNAIGILETVQAAGFRVPDDLAIAGFDDVPKAQHTQPALTSVRQDCVALGQAACELLIRQLEGSAIAPQPNYVATSLVLRESCGCGAETFSPPQQVPSLDRPILLAQELVRLATAPLPLAPDVDPESVWPGIGAILAALRQSVEGREPPFDDELAQAWGHGVSLCPSLETLLAAHGVLRRAGMELAERQRDGAAARARVGRFLDQTMLLFSRIRERMLLQHMPRLESLIQNNYEINIELLGTSLEDPRRLGWLRWTAMRWAALGLWVDESEEAELVVAGTYSRSGGAEIPIDSHFLVRQFPPMSLIADLLRADPTVMTIVIPIKTRTHAWGALALVGPINSALSFGHETTSQWATQLAAALEREALLAALEQQREVLRETNQQLVVAKESAETANELKTKFLSSMSHELRTPLNAILNFTRFLGDSDITDRTLSEQQALFQQRVLANGEHLLGLINDILDLSKIEAGKVELYQELFDLQPLLRGVMSTAIGLTKEKGLDLFLDSPADLPRVWADKTRVRQVLLNLLSNAAKFTERGSITLRAERRDDGLVQISVRDTGMGIAPEHLALVFEEFQQVQSAGGQHYQGTGLGLPISKRFIELHGGTMWVESCVGEGSSFAFTLPTEARGESREATEAG